jgi:hypothetical protein
MREHLTELLPLLLVGVVLLAFQLTRESRPGSVFDFLQPQQEVSAPTPLAAEPVTHVPRTPKAVASLAPASGLCKASSPTFMGGMAELKAALGASMGDPLECERAVDDRGDTQQNTTTGLAYYRKHANVVCFTTGWDHWARRADGVVHWTGEAVDPPGD